MSIFGWSYPAGCHSTPYDDFGPEVCPVCGKENWDEVTETYRHKSEAYCSDECELQDMEDQRKQADAEYQAYVESRETEALIEQALQKYWSQT